LIPKEKTAKNSFGGSHPHKKPPEGFRGWLPPLNRCTLTSKDSQKEKSLLSQNAQFVSHFATSYRTIKLRGFQTSFVAPLEQAFFILRKETFFPPKMKYLSQFLFVFGVEICALRANEEEKRFIVVSDFKRAVNLYSDVLRYKRTG